MTERGELEGGGASPPLDQGRGELEGGGASLPLDQGRGELEGEGDGGRDRRGKPNILRPVLAVVCFFFLIGWVFVSIFGSHRTPKRPREDRPLTRTPATQKSSTGVEGRWRHGTSDFVTVTASKDGSIIVDHKNTHAVFRHDDSSGDYLEKSLETGNTTTFRTLHFDEGEDTLRVQTFKSQGSDYTEENYVRAD